MGKVRGPYEWDCGSIFVKDKRAFHILSDMIVMGSKIRFWLDFRNGETTIEESNPNLFRIPRGRDDRVAD